MDHVSCTTATHVVNGSSTTELTLEFLVEAEDGTLTAAVYIACTATAGLECAGDVRVKTGERSRARGRLRIGGFGVLQADDVPSAAARGMDGWTAAVRDGRVRFNETVCCCGRHYGCEVDVDVGEGVDVGVGVDVSRCVLEMISV